jgi:hypothetical protein
MFAYKVLSASKASGKLELISHVVCSHDFAGPLSTNIVGLVDLDPSCADTSCRSSIVDGLYEMSDGAWVAGVVPLDLDGVTCTGIKDLDSRGVGGWDVASHVVALEVSDRAVGWWHPNADLVTGGYVVDP